jgi:hypothetical protein
VCNLLGGKAFGARCREGGVYLAAGTFEYLAYAGVRLGERSLCLVGAWRCKGKGDGFAMSWSWLDGLAV